MTLNEKELDATIAALYAYRSETTHYLRSYAQDAGHDDCRPKARAQAALRVEQRKSLEDRLCQIDGALMELDPT